MSKTLDISTINKLSDIFDNKKWRDNLEQEDVFENFCQLLANITNEQQELILELVDRYIWITSNQYQALLLNILRSVPVNKLLLYEKIILFPIMKPRDEKNTKSGHFMLYLTYSFIAKINSYKHIKFIKKESYDEIAEGKFELKPKTHIFLLDDYLGSGETIEDTIDLVLKNKSIKSENISVISLVSESSSIEVIEKNDITYYIGTITNKGISDNYNDPELNEKIRIMNEIERLIPDKSCKFGYNGSEGLITLIRTPDNTFPIFWKKHKKKDIKYDAPFERYE